jgi:hypothetical protein
MPNILYPRVGSSEWASAINDRGMRINVKKSKVMVITKNKTREPFNITWEEEQVEQVERFEYVGTVVTADGNIEQGAESKPNILSTSKCRSRKQETTRGYKNEGTKDSIRTDLTVWN